MLTTNESAKFESRGFLRLKQAISGAELRGLSEAAWAKLEQYQIFRRCPDTWKRPRPKGLQSTATTNQFNAMATREVREAVEGIFGHSHWEEPAHWGQLLVSLPDNKSWEIPSATWHIDLPPRGTSTEIPGVQIFVCLEDTARRGGATVAVAGSHVLVRKLLQESGYPPKRASASIRGALADRHSWLNELWSCTPRTGRTTYFMSVPTNVDGCHLQVVEFSGRAGDVILMHPYVFHAPSRNARERPRLALTQRLTAA